MQELENPEATNSSEEGSEVSGEDDDSAEEGSDKVRQAISFSWFANEFKQSHYFNSFQEPSDDAGAAATEEDGEGGEHKDTKTVYGNLQRLLKLISLHKLCQESADDAGACAAEDGRVAGEKATKTN